MLPAPFRVVLDANVLFPFTLRDTLLRAAEAGVYQMYWSETILEEVRRNLVATRTTNEEQAAHLLDALQEAFPEALVTGYESLIDSMPNDPKDRHVVAAAVKSGAQVIVTSNLKDFRELPDNIEAQSPDEFLGNLFDLDPEGMIVRVDTIAAMTQLARSFHRFAMPTAFRRGTSSALRVGRAAPARRAGASTPRGLCSTSGTRRRIGWCSRRGSGSREGPPLPRSTFGGSPHVGRRARRGVPSVGAVAVLAVRAGRLCGGTFTSWVSEQ